MKKGKKDYGYYLGHIQEDKKQFAFYLGRFQPVHNGHLEVISTLKEDYGNNFHIFVGKAHEVSDRSPFSAEEMRRIVVSAAKLDNKYVSILPDLTDETDNSNDWSKYLYDACKEIAGDNQIVFICGQKDLDKTCGWFEDYDDVVVDIGYTHTDVSATQVRELYNQVTALTPAIPKFRETNRIITVSGATAVGKTTLIQKLQKLGYSAAPEFDELSHSILCSFQTSEFDDEATQSMIAGQKFAHMADTQADIYERQIIDNLMFFDNEKHKGAVRVNHLLQRRLEQEFEIVKIMLWKPWEVVKKQIIARGRVNEQSPEALAFYEELWNKYDRWFKASKGQPGFIHLCGNDEEHVQELLKKLKGDKNGK